MESSPVVRTTCFRLRHVPMGFNATVTPTHIADAPSVPEPKGPMQADRITATHHNPSSDSPPWPSLAVLG